MLHVKLRNRTCQGLDRQGQGQGQGPSLQGPGQELDLQGQGQGLTSLPIPHNPPSSVPNVHLAMNGSIRNAHYRWSTGCCSL